MNATTSPQSQRSQQPKVPLPTTGADDRWERSPEPGQPTVEPATTTSASGGGDRPLPLLSDYDNLDTASPLDIADDAALAATPLPLRTRSLADRWRRYVSDATIINVIETGLRLARSRRHLEQVERDTLWVKLSSARKLSDDGQAALDELVKLGGVELVKTVSRAGARDELGLNIFFIDKTYEANQRMIFDASPLNNARPKPKHFKHDAIRQLRTLVRRGDFVLVIDISKAFYMIAVALGYRHLLRFGVINGEGNVDIYQWAAMAMGLAEAPLWWRRLLHCVLKIVRAAGVRVADNTDDLAVFAESYSEAKRQGQYVIDVLRFFGFKISSKNTHVPSQLGTYNGLLINTTEMTLHLPNDKLVDLIDIANFCLAADRASSSTGPKLTAKKISSLCGRLEFARHAVPAVQLWALELRQALPRPPAPDMTIDDNNVRIRDLKRQWTVFNRTRVHLSRGQRRCLYELIEQLPTLNESGFSLNPNSIRPDVTVAVDSSPTGTGGYVQRSGGKRVLLQANFSADEQDNLRSSNQRELFGLAYNFQACVKSGFVQHGDVVHFVLDSSTAISYINKFGGKQRHLHHLVVGMLRTMRDMRITPQTSWCPSERFLLPDKLSRYKPERNDWALSADAFDLIEATFGARSIDLFANRHNHKCVKYNSWRPDPGAHQIDTLSATPDDEFVYRAPYANMPFCKTGETLLWLQRHSLANTVVVVPHWPSADWWPLLLSMAKQWLDLPAAPGLFRSGRSGYRPSQAATWRSHAVLV